MVPFKTASRFDIRDEELPWELPGDEPAAPSEPGDDPVAPEPLTAAAPQPAPVARRRRRKRRGFEIRDEELPWDSERSVASAAPLGAPTRADAFAEFAAPSTATGMRADALGDASRAEFAAPSTATGTHADALADASRAAFDAPWSQPDRPNPPALEEATLPAPRRLLGSRRVLLLGAVGVALVAGVPRAVGLGGGDAGAPAQPVRASVQQSAPPAAPAGEADATRELDARRERARAQRAQERRQAARARRRAAERRRQVARERRRAAARERRRVQAAARAGAAATPAPVAPAPTPAAAPPTAPAPAASAPAPAPLPSDEFGLEP